MEEQTPGRDNRQTADRGQATDSQKLVLSSLPHTWLIDIDGTIAVHNGYLMNDEDMPLENSCAFLRSLPEGDFILLLTSRPESTRSLTEIFLKKNHIRYDGIVFGLPVGERILINDDKPSGLRMSYAIALPRDEGIIINVVEDERL